MTSRHQAYGLRIAANRPAPGLPVAASRGRADVQVWFASPGEYPPPVASPTAGHWYRSPELDANGRLSLEIWKHDEGYYHFDYGDGTEFLVGQNGAKVMAFTPPTQRLEDTAYYLNGPVLAFVLRLRGVTSLHASGVEMGGAAVLFTGPCGAGKSTTAAALAQRGHSVITEDLAPVDQPGGEFCCRAGYPRVNLWPDSVEALFGAASALPELSPPWPKRYLDSTRARFASGTRRIGAIYVITERASRGATEISALSPSEALVRLMANTYMNYLPGIADRARELRLWGAVASTIPVRALKSVTGDINGLCLALEQDAASLANRPGAVERVA